MYSKKSLLYYANLQYYPEAVEAYNTLVKIDNKEVKKKNVTTYLDESSGTINVIKIEIF